MVILATNFHKKTIKWLIKNLNIYNKKKNTRKKHSFEAQCNDFAKFNESKTKTMIVSGSRSNSSEVNPNHSEWDWSEGVWWPCYIIGVPFDAKMTFEKHIRSVSRDAAERLGIIRKFWQVFHDRSLLLRSSSWWRFRVQSCSSTICSSVMHAIVD